MNGWLLAGTLPLIVTGGSIFLAWCPQDGGRAGRVLIGVPVALLIGAASHALWYGLWLVVSGGSHSRAAYVPFDLALPALVLATWRRRISTAFERPQTPAGPRLPGSWLAAFSVAGTIVLAAAAISIVVLASKHPDGSGDAWASWNFKARWFVLGGSSWHFPLTNPALTAVGQDYPLLVPSTVARLWLFTGGDPVAVPQTVSATAGLTALALTFAGGCWAGGVVGGIAGTAALLVFPTFLLQSAWQYADVPLSCFYAATLILVCSGLRYGDPGWFLLAGVCAGGGLWTKNEGLLFALAVGTAIVLVKAMSRLDLLKPLALFIAGVAPFVAALTVLHWQLESTNDLFAGQTLSSMWQRATTHSRHVEIVQYASLLARQGLDRAGLLLFAAYLITRGLSLSRAPAAAAVIIVTVTVAGYYAIFLITPHDLFWHLDTTASRLFAQLWPSAVLAFLSLGPGSLPMAGDSPPNKGPVSVDFRS